MSERVQVITATADGTSEIDISSDDLIEKTTYSDHPLSPEVLASELHMKLAGLHRGEHLVLIIKHGGKAAS